MTEFEKGLRRMFSTMWDCEIDHPAWQDTVGDLMMAVIQLHESMESPDRSTDLISKHEAIKALGEEPLIWGDNDDYSLGQFNQWESDIKALDALPSAKNELTEHSVWFRISETLVDESKGHITSEQAIDKIRDYMYSMKIPPKGHWVMVSGFATPGGDPVWECSECGKGRHVYGIEHGSYGSDVSDGQWVSCPNCGADMRGEQNETDMEEWR